MKTLIEKFDTQRKGKKSKAPEYMHCLNIHKGEDNLEQIVVFFTGAALKEILEDETLQKSFIGLSYLADIMVGSGISQVQKRELVGLATKFVESKQYVGAVISNPQDQLMVTEADVVFSYSKRGMPTDI